MKSIAIFIWLHYSEITGMANFSMRILFMVLVIIFTIMVVYSQRGEGCRPLHDDEQGAGEFDGLLLQFLPRGPLKPSAPDPIHP